MLERSCSPRRHDEDQNDEIYENTIEENNDIEEHCLHNDEGTIDKNNDINLISSEEFSEHRVEIMTGDKPNSQWLLVDDHYFCHLKTKSEQEDVKHSLEPTSYIVL